MNKPVRKTMKDLDKYVKFCIASAIIFTIVIICLYAFTGSEPSTLVTCFFGMFGGEVFFCAMIKLFKLHKESKIQNGLETDKEEDEDDLT